MPTLLEKYVTGDRRSVMQQARLAIRDIYDAIVELVTNSDDRYQRLGSEGEIEIVVERGRAKTDRSLQVRDSADGMTLEVMDEKLSKTGGRVSGLDLGQDVRGTNSRGAKDIAALGTVTFDSVAAADGRLHRCEITDGFVFRTHGVHDATRQLRELVGIETGSGTRVLVRLGENFSIPQHDNLRDRIQHLVALRDILSDPQRKVFLRDSSRPKRVQLRAPHPGGKERVKESFEVPGYPQARAKLVITRAPSPFEREANRFRPGGIIVKSRHAIHEATYFDPDLETNPHALWFYGKLVCPFIDDLWNEFDDRFENGLPPQPANPIPILDPSRQTGLTRAHPFVQALYREALKRLRPLVEEERQREENQRAAIESDATRKRLDALEKAAAKFMEDFGEDEDIARDPDGAQAGSQFKTRGYALNPPFAQVIKGHSQRFALAVKQDIFPEIESGANVEVECLTSDISSDRRFVAMEVHPNQDGVLRAVWKVTALAATSATGIRAKIGPISAESAIEIFEAEADRYKDITTLTFGRKRYGIPADGTRKKIRVLGPIRLFPKEVELDVALSSRHFRLSGPRSLRPNDRLGVAIAEFYLTSDGTDATGTITVAANGYQATTEIHSVESLGAGLKIKLEDIDLKNQRSHWRQNVLEIAARHPSVARYLGGKTEGFPGQESKHFRLLLAEIVADAVCYKLVAQNIQANPEEYENADWDQYYADYSRYFSRFLPIAHKLQVPEGS